VCVCVCVHVRSSDGVALGVYIYIYIERERESSIELYNIFKKPNPKLQVSISAHSLWSVFLLIIPVMQGSL